MIKRCPYKYIVIDISEGDEAAYTAKVPKFPKMYICADTPEQLHEVVSTFIEEEIAYRKKNNIPIPKPDFRSNFSGKFVVRIKPEIHEQLTHLADAEEVSLNQYVNQIIEEKVAV